MKRTSLFFGLIFPLALVLFAWAFSPLVEADDEDLWRDYENYTVVDHDTTWSGAITREEIPKPVVVVNGATLTIAPGARVEIDRLTVFNGRIVASGTDADPIVFTKQPVDTSLLPSDFAEYDPECFYRSYPSGTIEFSDWVETADEEPSVFRNVVFERLGSSVHGDFFCPSAVGFGGFLRFLVPSVFAAEPNESISFDVPAMLLSSGKLELDRVSFRESSGRNVETAMYWSDEWESFDSLLVSDSNFESGSTALLSSFEYDGDPERFASRVTFRNNWYGDESGPTSEKNPSGKGASLSGTFTLDGWSTSPRGGGSCATCASNVLFIPGIKASKLYKEGKLFEDQLWPPTAFGSDPSDLSLDDDGKSREAVYTRDILEDIPTGNLYESFREELDTLKDEGTIADYGLFAYDWRQDVVDIAKHGTPYPDGGTKLPLDEIRRLAASSKSGKVTIVAHSNGGLLAKAILRELESSGETGLVDTVALVASPQMGTPLSVLSLLYGYDESLGLGLLLSRSEARELVENMPGAYGLLPSEEYFKRSEDPFIRFLSARTRYEAFSRAYGEGISDGGEFFRFLSGETDGRDEPEEDDLEFENVLDGNLLSKVRETHDALDSWTPPVGVSVIEIAGWGVETVSGVEYTEKEKARCYSAGKGGTLSCTGMGEYEPIYEPVFTVDGDKVVTAPSALLIPESDQVKRYWVDLWRYKKGLTIDRAHKDILEVDPVLVFLSNVISKKDEPLPEYLSASRPPDYDDAPPRIRMALYSPLHIHLYDGAGNHTGPKTITVDGEEAGTVEEGIPGSSYFEFGGHKYLSVPKGTPVRVEMDGYAEGSYSFELSEVSLSGETLTSTAFRHFPTTTDTSVSLSIPEGGITDPILLRTTVNEVSYEVSSVPGGEVSFPIPISEDTDDDDKDDSSGGKRKKKTSEATAGSTVRGSTDTDQPGLLAREWASHPNQGDVMGRREERKQPIAETDASGEWIPLLVTGILLVVFIVVSMGWGDIRVWVGQWKDRFIKK